MSLMAGIYCNLINSVGKISDEIEVLEKKLDQLSPEPLADTKVPHGVSPRAEGVVASFQETAEAFEFLTGKLASLNRRLAAIF